MRSFRCFDLERKIYRESKKKGRKPQTRIFDSEYLFFLWHCRRELPWKVEGELTGVSSKLYLLEQELVNLERIGKGDLMKVPYLLRKQVKRYQALAGKINQLCKRMQASDPCESALTLEMRTQRQTEFLLEASRSTTAACHWNST
ncbi:hypothetical protein Dimus_007767 [Dionaea muscipula]